MGHDEAAAEPSSPRSRRGAGGEAEAHKSIASPLSGLATLVSRVLVSGLVHYRACLVLVLPVLLALVVPLQVGVLVLDHGTTSPKDPMPASLFALLLTILTLIATYSLLPWAAGVLRSRPARPMPLSLGAIRRAVLVLSFLLLGISCRLGPTGYALPALAVVTLFWAVWPQLSRQAILGRRLFRVGMRRWRRSRPLERLTVALVLVLAEGGLVVLGWAAVVAVGVVGGQPAGWASQVLLGALLMPFHVLTLVAIGSELSLAPSRAELI